MAQIRVNLNNQMHNFYTSEIIVLPKKITSLNEEPELLVQSIKEVISDYLSKKENFDNKMPAISMCKRMLIIRNKVIFETGRYISWE